MRKKAGVSSQKWDGWQVWQTANLEHVVRMVRCAEIIRVPKYRRMTRYGNAQVAIFTGNRTQVPKSHSLAIMLGGGGGDVGNTFTFRA